MKVLFSNGNELPIQQWARETNGIGFIADETSVDAVETAIGGSLFDIVKIQTDESETVARYNNMYLRSLEKEEGLVKVHIQFQEVKASVDVAEELNLINGAISDMGTAIAGINDDQDLQDGAIAELAEIATETVEEEVTK